MTRKTRGKRDPVEHEIEVALNPGAFISDRACFSFVSDLHEVATSIAKLTEAEPSRAVPLYETFLAGCYEKVEQLDDSSGLRRRRHRRGGRRTMAMAHGLSNEDEDDDLNDEDEVPH